MSLAWKMTIGARRGAAVVTGGVLSASALLLARWNPVVSGLAVVIIGIGAIAWIRWIGGNGDKGHWWTRIAFSAFYTHVVVRIGDSLNERVVPFWVEAIAFVGILWIVCLATPVSSKAEPVPHPDPKRPE